MSTRSPRLAHSEAAAGGYTAAMGVAATMLSTLALVAAPAPDAPLPTTVQGYADDLGATTLVVRAQVEAWRRDGDPAAEQAPPALAAYADRQQRLHRAMGFRRRADRVIPRVVGPARNEVREVVRARRAIGAIPHTPGARQPKLRYRDAEPPDELRRHYDDARRRFGIRWDVLAAVNFVETRFGQVSSASSAGAQGPMQFLPSTWAAYGMGGDIRDPRDAIMGAANYLRASGGARGGYRPALFAYNRSTAYVSGVLRYAQRFRRDPRSYYALWAWPAPGRPGPGAR